MVKKTPQTLINDKARGSFHLFSAVSLVFVFQIDKSAHFLCQVTEEMIADLFV